MTEVLFKRLSNDAIIPTKGSRAAAGYDIYATEDAEIRPGEVHIFGSGFAITVPMLHFGAIFSRSGMSTKRGLTVSTGVSVIDSDYTGEVFVGIRNQSHDTQKIYKGDRIAQLVVIPFREIQFREVDSLPESERGSGGYGSTGR